MNARRTIGGATGVRVQGSDSLAAANRTEPLRHSSDLCNECATRAATPGRHKCSQCWDDFIAAQRRVYAAAQRLQPVTIWCAAQRLGTATDWRGAA